MQGAFDVLDEAGVAYEFDVRSAHRTPDAVAEYARSARERGLRVLICGAGLSAALPGAVAAHTDLPVIGVPLRSSLSVLDGLDALLSIAQMPPGVPVAAVGVDNPRNAAALALASCGSDAERVARTTSDHADRSVPGTDGLPQTRHVPAPDVLLRTLAPTWRGSRLSSVIARYSRPAMARIWSDEGKLERGSRSSSPRSTAWAELGVVPADAAKTLLETREAADARARRRDRGDAPPRHGRLRRRRRRAARRGGPLVPLRPHLVRRRRHRARAADPRGRRADRRRARRARSRS